LFDSPKLTNLSEMVYNFDASFMIESASRCFQ
jgi:hypothetical protein